MRYAESLNLECSHCHSNCQFVKSSDVHLCKADGRDHVTFVCTHCRGQIVIRFTHNDYRNTPDELVDYSPIAFTWKPKTNLKLIIDGDVRKDFLEAIGCFNNGFYNATMVMARRAMHREMIKRGLDKVHPNNLYDQIENSGISDNLRRLLQKVKNFGNSGAHPDFCLYDSDGGLLQNEEEFAGLSLNFLDKYFSDEYETESMIQSAPLSQKEIEEKNAETSK
ncbi:MAG: DUF4145 domain-containing protein [Candidatus Gracilibacteria bacterium]